MVVPVCVRGLASLERAAAACRARRLTSSGGRRGGPRPRVLRERVDDGHADAVQAARDLVAAAVAELAAGMEHGQHHLDRGPLLLLHDRDRDAAAVVRRP